jgi:DNA-binding GntR family transcriptional regulator
MLTERIADALADHEPGWRLPQPTILARRYSVSTAEIDKAIRELTALRILRCLPDGRVYLASPADQLATLEGLPGVGSHIEPMGVSITCASRHVSCQAVPPDIELILGLPSGAEVRVVRCLWTADGQRAAFSTAYLPEHLDTVENPAELGHTSLPKHLNSASAGRAAATRNGAIRPLAIRVEVQPMTESVARALQLVPDIPMIAVTVTSGDPSLSRPVALTAAALRSDLFRIVVEPPAADPPGQEPTGSSFRADDVVRWE